MTTCDDVLPTLEALADRSPTRGKGLPPSVLSGCLAAKYR
jgi:hypothetical protein